MEGVFGVDLGLDETVLEILGYFFRVSILRNVDERLAERRSLITVWSMKASELVFSVL